MKRIFSILAVCVLMFSLTGCFHTEEQDALLKYINEDMKDLNILETDMLASYQSVTGENATTDQAFYNELTTKTIVLAKDLSDKANKLTENITDEKILEVHKIYITYANTVVSAFTLYAEGAKNVDTNIITQGNAKMSEAAGYVADYKAKLNELGNEYDVAVSFNS
jgi:outer membrane murein-binding lipoprotein Lpp